MRTLQAEARASPCSAHSCGQLSLKRWGGNRACETLPHPDKARGRRWEGREKGATPLSHSCVASTGGCNRNPRCWEMRPLHAVGGSPAWPWSPALWTSGENTIYTPSWRSGDAGQRLSVWGSVPHLIPSSPLLCKVAAITISILMIRNWNQRD